MGVRRFLAEYGVVDLGHAERSFELELARSSSCVELPTALRDLRRELRLDVPLELAIHSQEVADRDVLPLQYVQ